MIQHQYINQILNKDSRYIIETLGDKPIITSTITSPPYFDMKDYGVKDQIGFGQSYENYLNDLKKVFSDLFKITKVNGSLWIIIDTFKRNNQIVTLPFDLTAILKEIGWLLQDIIIWKKDKTVPWSNNGFAQRNFEYILFLTKTTSFKYNKDEVRNFDTTKLKKWWIKYPERYNPRGKAIGEIWEFPIPTQGSWGKKYIRHFCPLPKEMVATMIHISSDEGDMIFDPFAGSGAVPFQAAIMKRRYTGFELNKTYIKMFEDYLDQNKVKAERELEELRLNNDQALFQKKILELRTLKYGRVLINSLNKDLKLELKTVATIRNTIQDKNILLSADYKIIGNVDNLQKLKEKIEKLTTKPPFSKFGIKPYFTFCKNLCLPKSTKIYCYTKTNSYSYSELSPDSSRVAVISDIKVNLNENDYS